MKILQSADELLCRVRERCFHLLDRIFEWMFIAPGKSDKVLRHVVYRVLYYDNGNE